MPTPYPGIEPDSISIIPQDIDLEPIVLEDVMGQLSHFSPHFNYIKAHISDHKLKKAYDTNYTHATHFQGIVRAHNSPYVFISGGDKNGQLGCIFVFKITSVFIDRRLDSLDFGNNTIYRLQEVSPEDKLEEIISISEGRFWHVGGISALGDLMVVPVEDGIALESYINFYNISNPLNPHLYNHITIHRDQSFGKIGCAAICNIQGHFLLVSWRDEGKSGLFDVYYSFSNDLNEGFDQDRKNVDIIRLDQTIYKRKVAQYQSLQFLHQSDGTIYLIGSFASKSYPAFLNSGKNMIDVFLVQLDMDDSLNRKAKFKISLIHQTFFAIAPASIKFTFQAATSFYNIHGRLALYSPFYWADQELKMAEFCQQYTDYRSSQYTEPFVALFAKENLKGSVLRFYGPSLKCDGLRDTSAQGLDFSFDVSSFCYLIPEDRTLVFIDQKDNTIRFKGNNGQIKVFPSLGKWNDRIKGFWLE